MTQTDLDITASASASFASESAILTVDLDAVTANYRQLRDLAPGAQTACVVKANAYGLGLAEIAQSFREVGCGIFFVATLPEGLTLRRLLGAAPIIYVLDGLMPGTAHLHREHDLQPCLSSLAEIAEWRRETGVSSHAALHFDTGMNRLGLGAQETEKFLNDASFDPAGITLVMSHLACAGEADHEMNAAQLARFRAIRGHFPDAHASLANTGGVLLGPDYHFDITRPGIGLYGGNPLTGGKNPFRQVIKAEARILQIRDIVPGETVGYGASWTAQEPARIAIVAAGYADGYFRALSSSPAGKPGGQAYVAGHHVPVAGRVSMDMICLDVTNLPTGSIARGDLVELIGPHVTVDDLGLRAGSFAYEVLTSLGERYKRLYTSAGRIMPESSASGMANKNGRA